MPFSQHRAPQPLQTRRKVHEAFIWLCRSNPCTASPIHKGICHWDLAWNTSNSSLTMNITHSGFVSQKNFMAQSKKGPDLWTWAADAFVDMRVKPAPKSETSPAWCMHNPTIRTEPRLGNGIAGLLSKLVAASRPALPWSRGSVFPTYPAASVLFAMIYVACDFSRRLGIRFA